MDGDVVEEAWDLHVCYKLSWFDCLLPSSAQRPGRTYFLSEDMGAGRQSGSLVLVNPFRPRRTAS